MVWPFRLIALLAVPVAALIPAATGTASGPRTAPSFYPGIYPALTAAYAAHLQSDVEQGRRVWLLNASAVGLAFARSVGWGHHPLRAMVLRSDARTALVAVHDRGVPAWRLLIRERRAGLTRNGIWTVIGCSTDNLVLTTPHAGARVTSPLQVTGRVRVFEGQFSLVILGPGWQVGGQRSVLVNEGAYTQPVVFHTTVRFDLRAPFAIVKGYSLSPKDGTLSQLSMVKVAL